MTWLRAFRNVRLMANEFAWTMMAIAGAGMCVGLCYAVWVIITTVMEKK